LVVLKYIAFRMFSILLGIQEALPSNIAFLHLFSNEMGFCLPVVFSNSLRKIAYIYVHELYLKIKKRSWDQSVCYIHLEEG
jgi:hypothetical protein